LHEVGDALLESESKYRSLFENMLNGFAYHKILVDDKNQLYHSKDLTKIDVAGYIRNLVAHLFRSYGVNSDSIILSFKYRQRYAEH